MNNLHAKRTDRINEYYFSVKLEQVRKLRSEGADIINLGIGDPDLDPPRRVIDSAIGALCSRGTHGYQPYRGTVGLRASISNWYKRKYNVELDPSSEVLPLLGSKEGIMHISLAFLNRGDGVLVPDPGYPAYESAARICDARVIHYDLLPGNGWFPDLKQLEASDLEGVKLMWVNYPNMPTGKVADSGQLIELAEFGKKNDILIVNDNPYSLILTEKPLSIFQDGHAMDNIMELNSLSKAYNMAGWRVGMLTGSKENINYVLKIKSNIDSGMFLPVQNAAIEAMDNGDEWLAELNSIYSRRRETVYKMLDLLGSEYLRGQAGLFVWSDLPGGYKSSIEYSDMLLNEHGIFITPGSVFGSNGRMFMRTSLCVAEDRLEECCERIGLKLKSKRI